MESVPGLTGSGVRAAGDAQRPERRFGASAAPRVLGSIRVAAALDNDTCGAVDTIENAAPDGPPCAAMGLPERDRTSLAIGQLSPRRRELLELLAKGFTNDEIARALAISPGTVRAHVTTILAQLDVTNRTEAAAAFVNFEAQPEQVARVMHRPAIAVLPLLPLDDAPRTRSLAAGITEDLASLFARWCWFPVISTLASTHARSLGRSPGEIAAALDARFLVDGSVRSREQGIRISVRIDDAETGSAVWADQRDVAWDALLEQEDALCHAAVAAAYPLLVSRVMTGFPRQATRVALVDWELAHDGMALRAQRERESNQAARLRFREALERDPSLVLAHFGIGLAAYDAVLNQWGPKEQALAELQRSAARCLELAPHGGEGHYLLGRHLQSVGDWEQAIEPLEAAVGLNPSFALAHACLAQSLQATGQSEASLVRMQHAARLGPRAFQAGLSTLHFMQAHYELALASAEGALATTPRYTFARALAAASAWWLGDERRGREHLRVLRASSPGFDPSTFSSTFGRQVDAVGRLTEALDALARSR